MFVFIGNMKESGISFMTRDGIMPCGVDVTFGGKIGFGMTIGDGTVMFEMHQFKETKKIGLLDSAPSDDDIDNKQPIVQLNFSDPKSVDTLIMGLIEAKNSLETGLYPSEAQIITKDNAN